MTHKIVSFLSLFLLLLTPLHTLAQDSGEKRIEFFSDNATMEDNPKQNNYNITIFSPDGQWKMQLNYYSESMFGEFGNEDFRLDTNGKNYNYVRNPKNDMVFYSFVDMAVTVTDEGSLHRIKANCLTSNKMRFIVEATIGTPEAKDTCRADLGYARIQPNSFYGTYAIYAENADYKLAYGVTGNEILGTFYRADILLPEILDKKTGNNIEVLTAEATHRQEGERTIMNIDILGKDLTLYKFTMFNGPYEIEIKEEKNISFTQVVLQDLSDFYGCYQFGAMNNDYQMGIAVKTDAFRSGKLKWTKDDLIMQYTNLLITAEGRMADIFDITVELEVKEKLIILKADVTCMDGILYHVTMRFEEDGYIPEAKDTVNIDFGHVAVLDYSKGLGMIGVGAVMPDKYQMRAYFFAHELEGEFTTSDFYMDNCDIMVVTGSTYVFHDAKYMRAKMVKEGEVTKITMDMYGVDEILYHATMHIDPLRCMQDGEYPIDLSDDVSMVAIQADFRDNYGQYYMQLQDLHEHEEVVDSGHIFSFYFGQEGTGVAGSYSTGNGTLYEDEMVSLFYENGCETRVGTVSCTLELKAVKPVTITLEGKKINTNLYEISFQMLGQNGAIYTCSGKNVLICLNQDGEMIDITEDYGNAIEQAFAEEGLKVRKILKDGKIIVEKAGSEFDLTGRRIK